MLTALKKRITISTALTLLAVGCGNRLPTNPTTQTKRTALIGNLESYLSPEEVRSQLGPDSSWDVVGESQQSPDDPRPPHNVLEVSIKNHLHLGCSGELRLHFFNGQLVATVFYPDEFELYVAAASKAYGLRFDHREITISPFTLIQLSAPSTEVEEFGGRGYVMWSDVRLAHEMDEWILKHS